MTRDELIEKLEDKGWHCGWPVDAILDAIAALGLAIVPIEVEKSVLIAGKNKEEEMLRRGHKWTLSYREAYKEMVAVGRVDKEK